MNNFARPSVDPRDVLVIFPNIRKVMLRDKTIIKVDAEELSMIQAAFVRTHLEQAAGEALTTAIELVRRNMMPENHGTPIGNAVDFLVRTNVAVGQRNIAECGRLAREYALETLNWSSHPKTSVFAPPALPNEGDEESTSAPPSPAQ
ncbi:MAG: hypothetical protein Q8O64_05820 [Sideroxyarcus sp.]|nr:hypothetical protein [Sideroxyarcus sp.]